MEKREIGAHLFTRFMACFVVMIITCRERSCAVIINNPCPASSCGNLRNITHPFRLTTDPEDCGDPVYELTCQNNKPVIKGRMVSFNNHFRFIGTGYFSFFNYHENFYVEAIDYRKYTIRLLYNNVADGNCSSLPSTSLTHHPEIYGFESEIRFSKHGGKISGVHRLNQTVTFLKCKNPVHNTSYLERVPCVNDSVVSDSERNVHSYAVVGKDLSFSDLEESCRFELVTWISPRNGTKPGSYSEIQQEIAYGLELSWMKSNCKYLSWMDGVYSEYYCSRCYFDEDTNKVHCPEFSVPSYDFPPYNEPKCGFRCILSKLHDFFWNGRVYFAMLSVPRIVCMILVIALLTYKCKRRHLSVYDNIEEFLESNNNLMPVRYSYWEIIVMTRGFSEKLGEGGFGTVYKGKLSSGNLVAVKMLNKSKANGQDFINEVTTTGRIHHVNVVQLIGFCFARSKRALIYKFMPNGSLDNYVFLREGMTKLISHKELFEISLGVARGIEYLHRGCDMQILHFDIKPHNILLDENFTPKVSDFGLARLCPLDNSIVPLTAARGTMGYIAPELFYKNIGHVSHKADVYSFGMLLMEMASRRRNLNAVAENSSQIFYPLWVYDHLNEDKEMTIENVAGEDLKTMKKMVIVALWCIQLKPSDRPSLNKVIEMLEGEVESLEMPPKPYLNPYEKNDGENQNAEESSVTSSSAVSDEDSPEISLVLNVHLSS